MKEIILHNGMRSFLDDEDFEKFGQMCNWACMPHGRNYYARGFVRGTKNKKVLLHRIILGITDRNIIVDHKDGDGLNNQKSNLRICTCAQNMGNRRKNLGGSSKFKGVSFHKRDGIYSAQIGIHRKRHHLGNFKTEIEAALAYNDAALKHFGDFAKLNNIII